MYENSSYNGFEFRIIQPWLKHVKLLDKFEIHTTRKLLVHTEHRIYLLVLRMLEEMDIV